MIWILAKITALFMKSLHVLNIIFTELPGGKLTGPGEFNFFSGLKYLDLVLISGAELDGYWGTWTGCLGYLMKLKKKHDDG